METKAAANHVQAPEVDSSSIEISPPSSTSPHNNENITRIDGEFYKAAVEGDFNKFININNLECLLTPNKNTVLHIHLTSTTTETTRSVSQPFIQQVQGKFRDLVHKKTETAVSEHFVEQILDKCGGLVLLLNTKGETPLHLAARYGHSTVIKLLVERAKSLPHEIESGIGVEKKPTRATTRENDDTALHLAVRYQHIEVVEILLEMDPDLSNIANKANETPLYLASERHYSQVMRKILEKVESPAYEGPNDRTTLHAAVINDDLGNSMHLAYVHLP